ncbi:MAG: DUF6142 family protein [Eubacteriales bacterium]|nr:DUF6142 family protein [Eubacteriales bacterium]
MAEKKKKYSYIKYPHSRNGKISIITGSIAFLVTCTVLVFAIVTDGNAGSFMSALGFTAFILSLIGTWVGLLAMGEKETNHLFAYIGGGISLLVFIAWVLMIL